MEKGQSSNEVVSIPKNVLYLGLHVQNSVESLLDIVSSGLKGIIDSYPEAEDAKILRKQIEDKTFESDESYGLPWKYPKKEKKWHLTTLFKKGPSFTKSHPAYTSFEDGKKIIVEITGIAYVPGKIITSIVVTDTPVANEFPHLTTLIGAYAPKNSNDLLKEIFSENAPLENEYVKIFKNVVSDETYVQSVSVKILNRTETVYVYKFPGPYQIETEMKMFTS